MNIATERPASQATTLSIGALGSFPKNNIKYNPAIMSGIQLLMLVFLGIFLGNLMSYLIEDFQSDDDLSDHVAWLFCEIFFNIFILRSFFHWAISQKQGFRQFMKSAVLQLASDFKIDIGIKSSNTSRLMSPTKSNRDTGGHVDMGTCPHQVFAATLTLSQPGEADYAHPILCPNQVLKAKGTPGNINVVTHEKSHKRHEEGTQHNTTLGLNALIKSEVEEQDIVKIQQQTVPLNTVNVELLEANDKPDLKNIKEKIKTELEMTQELQSVAKGKGKGKGQSNFKKGKISGQQHVSEDESEEIKQEPKWKEENKKITKSALASRQALKKWKERTKQYRVRKSVRVGLSRNQSYQIQLVQLGLN